MPRRYATRRRRAPVRRRRYGRRKTYARRNYGRTMRGNSRKAMLNVTSIKKRDTMRIATINSGAATAAGMRGVGIPIPADGFWSGIWCPSWRLLVTDSSGDTYRNRRTTYLKGLREEFRVELGTNLPIEMRRIVFASPDRVQLAAGQPTTAQPSYFVESDTNRYWRTLGSGGMNYDYLDEIFAGQRNIDWLNPMTAKTDTKKVKIISDKRFRIASGSNVQTVREFKFYDPINKNMTYDDEENGGQYLTSGWSEYSRQGTMQNVYVVTLFYGVTNSALTPYVDINSTVYWHER
ncbi:MAG: capsid protein [Gemykroznavirus anima1]|uniref:capsid protein n=1 Tax=Genomoviridae sp. TaxID=2202565 RepID=UPI002481BD2A|nr:MAG: capsid protein [Genomoviridae sp.]QCW23673.1 MAG: capsid protein [Genomoviridae sp.]